MTLNTRCFRTAGRRFQVEKCGNRPIVRYAANRFGYVHAQIHVLAEIIHVDVGVEPDHRGNAGSALHVVSDDLSRPAMTRGSIFTMPISEIMMGFFPAYIM